LIRSQKLISHKHEWNNNTFSHSEIDRLTNVLDGGTGGLWEFGLRNDE